MRYGLGIRVTDTAGSYFVERNFDKFPVRIGRSPLNDLTIDQPFVSEFHAVLEQHDGRLLLRDLGSTNGTLLRSVGRMSPNQLVDLASYNYEFAIVSLIFQTHTVQLEDGPRSKVRPLAISNFYSEQAKSGDRAEAHPQATALMPQYQAYRAAFNTLLEAVSSSLGQLPAEARAKAIQSYAQAMPALASERDFQRLAASVGVNLGSEAARTTEEVVALQGLKQLAAEQVKGRGTPEGVDQLVHFLNKLKALLEVFFKSFIPLRDGYRKFELDMDLGKLDQPLQGAVDGARTPEELAAGLLDWTRADEGEAADIESTFANLMIHQVAMLNGVMNGVKQLLEELSPATIEASLDDPQARKPEKLAMGPFRFKALWKLYEQRHGDLSAEDRHVFALLFGRRFAEAYSRFQGERVASPRHTIRHQPKSSPSR